MCWIYVDFRNFSPGQASYDHIVDWVFEYVRDHPFLNDYESCVRHAYASQIEALRNGPLSMLKGDPEFVNRKIAEMLLGDFDRKEPYARRIISYLTYSKIPVFLVIDNVDQVENVDTQSRIFLDAIALSRYLGANLILSMRDATYVKNRGSSVFNAFDFDAVYIDPPNILAVLARRFTVAEQLLKGKKIEFQTDAGAKVQINNGKIIIDMLSYSVLGTEVGRIIEVAATGDTRLALQMTRQFLQYGYTSTAKAVALYQQKGRYQLPLHEAVRAIMLGNQNVYREEFSVFGNPFDSSLGRSDQQLLRLYVMNALVSFGSEREFEGIPAKEIVEVLEKMGFSEGTTEAVLRDLIKFRYIFSRSHGVYTRKSLLIPSRLCGYVVRELIGRMIFIETILFDTFIGNDDVWEAIKENMRLIYKERNLIRKVGMRREVSSLFFDFLEDKLEKIVQHARDRGLPPQWCVNALTRIKDAFREDLTRAMWSAKRNYGPSDEIERELPLFEFNEREVKTISP